MGSLFILIVCPTFLLCHSRWWAAQFLYFSIQLHAIYFIIEVSAACILRRAVGDFSALWILSKKTFFLILAVVVACHGFVYFLLHH